MNGIRTVLCDVSHSFVCSCSEQKAATYVILAGTSYIATALAVKYSSVRPDHRPSRAESFLRFLEGVAAWHFIAAKLSKLLALLVAQSAILLRPSFS
jgi:hypothetical protein